MPVPLVHDLSPIEPPHHASLGKHGRIEPEPHGAAHISFSGHDISLIGHGGDHRVRRIGVELSAISTVQARLVPADLDRHALEAETEPEHRDLVEPGVPDRADLAFDTAYPEATR